MSGLTSTGFQIRRLEEIILAIRAELEADFGPNFNTDGDSVAGQIIAGPAIEIALVWEGLNDQYQAYNPDQATGDALGQIARLNGLTRLGAERATGTISITGTPATVIPVGSRALNPTTAVTVETTEEATIGGGGTASIAVRAVEAGVVVSAANGITSIVTPVAGWSTIASSTALEGGRSREDDASLRARIAASTAIVASVEGAMRTRLLTLEGVEQALVISNRGLTTDSNGTPGKSIRAVISPDLSANADAEDAIASALFTTQPAGIQTIGIGLNARVATVVDQQGFTQTVEWEYPTIVPVEFTITALVDLSVGPLTAGEAEDLALEALETYVEGLAMGDDVLTVDVQCALRAAVPGLRDITALLINGGAPSLTINFNEIASFNVLTAVTITPA